MWLMIILQALFLSGLVEPDAAAAWTQSSLKAMSEDSPNIQLASRHCFLLEDGPNRVSCLDQPGVLKNTQRIPCLDQTGNPFGPMRGCHMGEEKKIFFHWGEGMC
eukprot:TRINITY_DN4025_c0_g3_i1.p1 TRINITY_DN4025_c0_g3~~TRINITY_DN4025_c0_g3_i1.p1  ORF type:complete len:105 (+),score=21.74 TRINITY_DN4025_c0_g3_i1:500-814(+)